jgi:pyruvate dehydrogenase E1 component
LRRHFEVDAQCIVIATLYRLSLAGEFDPKDVAKAIETLGVDSEKIDPYFA